MTTEAPPEELKPKTRPKRGTPSDGQPPLNVDTLAKGEEPEEKPDDPVDLEYFRRAARNILLDPEEPTATAKTPDGAIANAATGEVISPGRPTLTDRLLAVMGEIDAIEKRGENEAQHYSYQRAVDVTREVRKAFMDHGVLLITSIDSLETKTFPGSRNTPIVLAEVTGHFIVTDGSERFEFGGAGTGIDTGDKGIYKAITGMLKYGLRTLLLIPDERDDPEVQRTDERDEPMPELGPGPGVDVKQGGRQKNATTAQLAKIKERAQALSLSPSAITEIIKGVLGTGPELNEEGGVREQQQAVLDFLTQLTFEECGQVVQILVNAEAAD